MNRFPDALRIEITQDDIDNGVRISPTRCPVARAINRIYPDILPSVAGSTGVGLMDPDDIEGRRVAQYESNPALSSFVRKYDRDEPVTPQVIWVERVA